MTDMQRRVAALIAKNERENGEHQMYPHERMQLELLADLGSSMLRIANAQERIATALERRETHVTATQRSIIDYRKA